MSEGSPPLGDWTLAGGLDELARISRRFPFEDFDRDARPRLARLTREQVAIVEQGLLVLGVWLGSLTGPGAIDAGGRLNDLLDFFLNLPGM